MWVRKRLDIGWSDLAFGIVRCLSARQRPVLQHQVEQYWSSSGDALACLSVRSGFDLLLGALQLPRGSEVLISAITIPDMGRILEHHGLVPVPVDLDVNRLAPDTECLRQAITPSTRAIVVAHLFGSRVPMKPILDLARQHGLLVIEDCAQVFDGGCYRGHPEADVSMFSFGPIKAATALGGGLVRVRDRELLRRMRTRQADYPLQDRGTYLRRLLKYSLLKTASSRPVFSLVVRGCEAAHCDYDGLVSGSARGFAGPHFFARIRRQPSAALLAVLDRRLRNFNPRRAAKQKYQAESLLHLLERKVICPGANVVPHTHWVFPILVSNPNRVLRMLRRRGFDATQGQSLCVISPPMGRPGLAADVAGEALARLVFLPLYPEMPARCLRRMAAALPSEGGRPVRREAEREPACCLNGSLA